MDYVVFGIGFGASLLVLGLLIRDVGPRLRFRNPASEDGVFHAEELVARVSWRRFCGALGTVWAIAGLAFVTTTVICMVFMVSDARAGWIMGISLLVLVIVMAFWTWAFFDRFGSYGILPEREHVDQAAPSSSLSTPRKPTVTVGAPKPRTHPVGTPTQAEKDDVAGQELHASGAESDADDREVLGEHGGSTSDDTTSAESNPAVQPVLQTPEERMKASNSPLDHESQEADLDTPAHGGSRPRRQSFQPSSRMTESENSADSDEPDTSAEDEENRQPKSTDRDEPSSPEPESGSREAPPREGA